MIAQAIGRQVRIPGIVLLLIFGFLLGPDAAGWVEPASLGPALFGIVDLAVAIILFEGGLNLEVKRLKREEAAIRWLITVGAAVTLAGGTWAAWWVLGFPWELALLFGSLVVVTGPTVVTPLLRDMRLKPRLKTILEAEGVLIDPIGAILAVLALEIVAVPARETLASSILELGIRLGFGVAAGVAGGLILAGVLRVPRLLPQGFDNILALASVILLFHGADALVSHSGILAVTVAGVVVGNLELPISRDLREFKDQLTVMFVGLVFVLLAADVQIAEIESLGGAGLAVLGLLVLVVRPANAFLSTVGTDLSLRERAFIAWVAPRGIVAAAIASVTATELGELGLAGGDTLRALVFLVIAGTVLVVGLTARPLAAILGLRLPSRDRIAILGAQGLGLALAAELKVGDRSVVILESDPRRVQQAEKSGLSVVFGDALQERTLLRAQIELVGIAVGATFNDHLNSLFVSEAMKVFGVPRGFILVEALGGEKPPDHVPRAAGDVLFDGPHDQERWDVRLRHGDVEIETFVYAVPPAAEEAPESAPPAAPAKDPYVILTVRRKDRLEPMSRRFKLKDGDSARVALYKPERDEAIEQLRRLGWSRQEPASVSEASAAAATAEAAPAAADRTR